MAPAPAPGPRSIPRPRRRLAAAAAIGLALGGAGCPRRGGPDAPALPPAGGGSGEAPAAEAGPGSGAAGSAAAARPVQPDLCHASVAWRSGAFEVVGLPCVTRDGAEVLLARSDGRPRYPDLAIATVTRADRISRAAIVMEPHESGELLDAARRPTPELEARLVKANVLLAEVARAAVPLPAWEPTPAGTFRGGGLELAWTEAGRLTLSREGRFVHGGDYGHWLERLTACAPPAYLAQVWGDAGRGVLLIEIAYRGSGGCTALPELHVVSWTPSPA